MEFVKDIVSAAVAKAYPSTIVEFDISRPEPSFGDFSTNVALKLSKQVGSNPRDIATNIVENLDKSNLNNVTIAGPGFVNFFLGDNYFEQTISTILERNYAYGSNESNKDKKILVEYSDPNPLKPLHAGHLYTTLVGDTIARLIESSGANVTRINYGGDVGLHVARSMWAIVKKLGGENPTELENIPLEERANWLGSRYVEGTNAYEDDETAKQEIIETNKRVYAVHADNDHDSPFAKIYWKVRQWSYDYFAELYTKLEVTSFDRYLPESEVTPLGLATVHEQTATGVYKESQGAIVFDGEAHGLHTRVFINSEGLPTYEAKDVGLLLTKWRDYTFDTSIVITANEQAQYMQVMLKSVEQFAPEPAKRSMHLTHGVLKLQGGAKMSSRKGTVLLAVDILDAAKTANIEQTGKDDQSVVLAAIKYAFLKTRIGSDIIYNPEESVSVMGNSGPYLQYAYVRATSILRKSTTTGEGTYKFNESDRNLVGKLSEYPEVIAKAAVELMPHHVCTYLYELAQEFNRFYETNQVVGSERELELKQVLEAYMSVLGGGLTILGISLPEKM